MRVKCTREGLIGGTTATGYRVDKFVPFVALPSSKVLNRAVRVTNPANGRSIVALVLDIGPWNISDDAYVLHGERPQAESGHDVTGRITNHAGIDLGEKVWHALGLKDNADVDWEFID